MFGSGRMSTLTSTRERDFTRWQPLCIAHNSDYSKWYFPQAKALNKHSKLLLVDPSMDRSGAVVFRCVKDID